MPFGTPPLHSWRLSCAGIALLLLYLVVRAATACEENPPKVQTEPVARFTLAAPLGDVVAAIEIDPRGVRSVATTDAPNSLWVLEGGDSTAWDYREWQWWRGHPWGDSCRPRYYSQVEFQTSDRSAAIDYQIDGFDCRQTFLFPDQVDVEAPRWDVVTRIRNVSGASVVEYGQFFACYTQFNQNNSFWFWDASGKLVRFAEYGVEHLNGYAAHPEAYFLSDGAIPHCPRGDGKIIGSWAKPVLVSHASPEGWRSVVMIEARYAAALAQGMGGGAMDYILFPGPEEREFADQAEFAVHIRHHLVKSPQLPTMELLERLWRQFEQAHPEIHAVR